MHLLAAAPEGISSLRLAEQIGVTQKTAWFMLQRLRETCGIDPTDLAAVTNAVLFYRPAAKGQAAAKIERRVKSAEATEKKGGQTDGQTPI